jgi:hypothetical protein
MFTGLAAGQKAPAGEEDVVMITITLGTTVKDAVTSSKTDRERFIARG